MSKERLLLVRAKVLLECVDTAPLQDQADLIIKEIQELLAQPEHINFDLERMKLAVESPVSDITGEELMKQVKTNRVFYQEGYAQAELDLKREPLSESEMRAIWKEGIRGEIPFVEIGRAIEKAHERGE